VKSPDPISVIETAYRLDGDVAGWLAELASVVSKAFGADQGAMAALYDASGENWVQLTAMEASGVPLGLVQSIFNRPDVAGKAIVDLLRSARFSLISQLPEFRDLYRDAIERHGVGDLVAMNDVDPRGVGAMLVIPDQRRNHSYRTQQTWRRVIAHVSAASRLRSTLAAAVGANADLSSQAEAVLSASGRVEHATGPAEARGARESLREALVRMDRARSRRADPEECVELWRGLVAGRWSVVEHFESDGKRYYLAHKNDVELAAHRALTPREEQVLGYAERGHSNKLIAYSLGLSISTVSTLLSKARRKLGKSLELLRTEDE